MAKAEYAQIDQGEEILSWQAEDISVRRRGLWWYVFASVAAAGLLIYAIRERNFLFAFIVIMFAIIFATHHIRSAAEVRFAITDLGLRIGSRFFPWRDIEEFWIAYEPPAVKTLYVEFSGLRPRLPIPLEDADPNQVREVLRQFIAENSSKHEEPISDWVARVLKI